MRILRFAARSGRFPSNILLVFTLAVAGAPLGLSQNESKSNVKYYAPQTSVDRIPQATLPCTAEEASWWEQIRATSRDMLSAQRNRDDAALATAKEKFYALLLEQQAKSYRVPIPDRPPIFLIFGRPAYNDVARNNDIKGNVLLSVEAGTDGKIGDVNVVKGLGYGLDENAIKAMRQSVFLPAIKDGAFVSDSRTAEITFDRR